MDEAEQKTEVKALDIIEKATDTAKQVVHDAKSAAQAVLSTAERRATELERNANSNPSNRELQDTIRKQEESFKEHSKEDIKQFAHIHERLDGMATKEDIGKLGLKLEPILDVYKAVLLSKGFVLGLGAVIVSITAIGVGFIWLINSVRH